MITLVDKRDSRFKMFICINKCWRLIIDKKIILWGLFPLQTLKFGIKVKILKRKFAEPNRPNHHISWLCHNRIDFFVYLACSAIMFTFFTIKKKTKLVVLFKSRILSFGSCYASPSAVMIALSETIAVKPNSADSMPSFFSIIMCDAVVLL